MPLLEKAGRGLRLTDPALVLVGHAEALLERAALAEADLAAAAGAVAGRGRIAAFESVALQIALPAIEALGREAPRLRCELVEAEPEQLAARARARRPRPGAGRRVAAAPARPARRRRPPRAARRPGAARAARRTTRVAARHPEAVPLAELAGEPWATGDAGMAWEEMTRRTCRALGGFDPDVRHRVRGRDRRAGARRARARRGDAAGAAARRARRGPRARRRRARDRRGLGRPRRSSRPRARSTRRGPPRARCSPRCRRPRPRRVTARRLRRTSC